MKYYSSQEFFEEGRKEGREEVYYDESKKSQDISTD